ncbi:MAG: hypothetical protein ABSC19_18975 [Syntrophorhabdales bacterium]
MEDKLLYKFSGQLIFPVFCDLLLFIFPSMATWLPTVLYGK